MSSHKNWISAEDYIRRIEEREAANPEIRARREQVEREREKRIAEAIAEQEEMMDELRALGYSGERLFDVVGFTDAYKDAIPILLKHAQRVPPYSDSTQEELIRALTVKDARGVFNPVAIRLFRENTADPRPNGIRWCLANALSIVAELSDVDELLELLKDIRHRGARGPLVGALLRFVGTRPDIVTIFDSLRDDPDIGVYIAKVETKNAVQKARDKLARG